MHGEYGGAAGGLAVLQLIQITEDERLLRSEVFELDQHDLALRRLHELSDIPVGTSPSLGPEGLPPPLHR